MVGSGKRKTIKKHSLSFSVKLTTRQIGIRKNDYRETYGEGLIDVIETTSKPPLAQKVGGIYIYIYIYIDAPRHCTFADMAARFQSLTEAFAPSFFANAT